MPHNAHILYTNKHTHTYTTHTIIHRNTDLETKILSSISILGLKDYTGTLSGFVASTLLTPGDIMNGNLTNVIDGLVDVN